MAVLCFNEIIELREAAIGAVQSFCISTIPGGQMQEGTTPGKEDDCRDAGGRATQGAVAELESRRATCKDAGS